MKNLDEISIALQLYDCLTPDERHQIHALIAELSSGRESSVDSPGSNQQTV